MIPGVHALISYSQNFEDVMLARAFPSDYRGFYIDIGAGDPEWLSVTKHFYDHGWHGINVEPVAHFHRRLVAERPRDINLAAVVGAVAGSVPFFEHPDLLENSSTLESSQAIRREVEAIRLETICDKHLQGRAIDFLKIDTEGAELDVLQSGNWKRYRPIILVIEAVEVDGVQEVNQSWEPFVLQQDYLPLWNDGLNRFYVRQESSELRQHFKLPPNVFDHFETAESVKRLDTMDRMQGEMDMLRKACEERLQEVISLTRVCEERLVLINSLDEQLRTRSESIPRQGSFTPPPRLG
jgi:FkbM family methyltransferase